MKLKCKGSRILLDFIANFSMNIYKLKKKTKKLHCVFLHLHGTEYYAFHKI